MKTILTFLVLVLSHSVLAIPVILDAPVSHLYVPAGFDDNDNVEVVVSGEFPSLCYTKNMTEVTVNGDTINIHISSLFNLPGEGEKGNKCGPMIIPFKEVVTIGNLVLFPTSPTPLFFT